MRVLASLKFLADLCGVAWWAAVSGLDAVQIVDALERVIQDMLNCADRPTEEQLDRFDRLHTAAVVHRYADTGSR